MDAHLKGTEAIKGELNTHLPFSLSFYFRKAQNNTKNIYSYRSYQNSNKTSYLQFM